MNQDDRDRILQLVAHVRQTYDNAMKSYARLDTEIVEAHALLPAIIASLNQPERHYYCPDCGFQPAEESGPDLVCTKCRLVLITFREVEELP